METEGTRHICRLRREGLAALRAWVDGFWDDVLEAYATSDGPATTDKPESEEP